MKMGKLYFREGDDEVAYDLETHYDYMRSEGIKELKVYRAKAEIGTGMFWCQEYQEIGDTKESCGKQCEAYKPRNGKSGICKHYGYPYEKTDEVKTLKVK